MNKILIEIFLINFLFFSSSLYAENNIKNLGQYGRIYEIKEKDALIEIHEQAQRINFQEKLKKTKKDALKKYRPKNSINLPETQKEKIYTSSIFYTVPYDIPNGQGGILYPKGYKFNVLNYTSLHQKIIIFDVTNEDHIKWIKESGFLEQIDTMFLSSTGNATDLFDFIKNNYRKIYFCTEDFIKKFNVPNLTIPSILWQEKNFIKIHSIPLRTNYEKKLS